MTWLTKISLVVVVGFSCCLDRHVRSQESDFFWSTHNLNEGIGRRSVYSAIEWGRLGCCRSDCGKRTA